MENVNLVSPPEAYYTVYKLTDPEGKIYIGLTGKPVEQRWLKGRGYSRDTPIRAAITRFGWDAFQKEILCEKLTKEGGEKLEKWFIATYDSSDPAKGYNRFLGGLGKGVHMSEVSKKICRKVKNRQYTERPELIRKIRDSVNSLYENDPDYRRRIGKAVVEAFERDPSIKTRISNKMKQHWQDPAYRDYITKRVAEARIGNRELCEKQQDIARQFFQKHPERRAAISVQMSRYLLSPQGRKFVESDSSPKPVRCVETGEVFPSQRAAERATGFLNIHKICGDSGKTCGGFHWEYCMPE